MSKTEGRLTRLRTTLQSNGATSTPPPAEKAKRKGAIADPFPVYSSHAEDYEIKDLIGTGASSLVYEALFKPLNLPCAVKCIDVDRLSTANVDRLRREASIMSLSKHPNVLRIRGEWLQGSKLYVAARLMAAGSLLDIMSWAHPDGFDEVTIATILKQALDGLLYFHDNGWLHRDIKAANMLVDEDGTVLLADFGVSSVLVNESRETKGDLSARKSFVGSPAWMSPEVINGKGYDEKADIWSLGITALELSTGHAPHAYMPASKALHKTVFEAAPTVAEDGPKQFSKSFKDLVDSCLRKDPSKRPAAKKLLSHAFFKQAKRPSHLVSTILADLPPLQARQTRRRAVSEIAPSIDSSWDFGSTIASRGALSPLTSPNDPFASFTGRHLVASPPVSPAQSHFLDLAPADGSIPRSTRRISFNVKELPSKASLAQITEVVDAPPEETKADRSAKAILNRFGFR